MAIQQWMPVDVKERMKGNRPLQIIDVREPAEFASGHIPGAKLIPLGQLMNRSSEINPSQDCVVVCRSGNRSAMACQFLQQKGFNKLYNLMGGMNYWDGEVSY